MTTEQTTSWIDQIWSLTSTKNNDDEEKKEKEENDIMSWFKSITSGADSDKNRSDIISEVKKELKESNMYTRLMDSKYRNASKLLSKLSHRFELSYPPKSKLITIDDTELIKDLQYNVRYALASYRKMKLAFTTKENVAFKSTKTLLRDYYDIPTDDIIIDNSSRNLQKWSNEIHSPRYILLKDAKMKRIILSIRGTDSTQDRISDINANAKKYNAFDTDGYVHEGILASAKYIVDNVTCQIVKQCKENPEYQLFINGHSLGGGVAALVGFMYYQHPILHLQNKLKVFAFASPPIVSQEFITSNIGFDYIYSIALSTDFITRLSKYSIKTFNLRNDFILETKEELIDQCLKILDDGDKTNDNNDDDKEDDNDDNDNDDNNDNNDDDKNEREQFIDSLRKIQAADTKLYPIGKVLWFVPKAVMEDDVILRRKYLLELQEMKHDQQAKDDGNEDETEEQNNKQAEKTSKCSWTQKWEEMSIKCKEEKAKKALKKAEESDMFKYGADKFILCEATKCRDWFQEFVIEYPESLRAHMPGRYLWACGTTIINT